MTNLRARVEGILNDYADLTLAEKEQKEIADAIFSILSEVLEECLPEREQYLDIDPKWFKHYSNGHNTCIDKTRTNLKERMKP